MSNSLAAFAAVYASHVIHTIRREAFRARQFGQYRLLERLGTGGMGEVYKAEHMLLKRPCAIKLIKPGSEADSTALARFEREVRATTELTHWNTVEMYDYGHIPADLEQIVLRCLAKKPDDRFPDVASLEEALAACGCANEWDEREAADWWRATKNGQRDL